MKQVAVLALAGAIWLMHRRQQDTKEDPRQMPPLLPPPSNSVKGPSSDTPGVAAPLAASPPQQSGSPTPTIKPILGPVLHWIFLILLGSALSLTAAKGSWDVFAVLVAAASVQLGGQLARWLDGGGGGGRRGGARPPRGGAAGHRNGADTAVPPRPVVLRPDLRLAGVWIKDAQRSEPMDEALAAMRLNGLVRTAVRLIRGLELDGKALKAGRFSMAIFSVISWFKVRESYLLDGSVGHFNRRDLRRGKHAGSVAVQPDGSVLLSVSWGEPLAGSGTDYFTLAPTEADASAGAYGTGAAAGMFGRCPGTVVAADSDLLVVTSTIKLAAAGEEHGGAAAFRTITYRTVYMRGGGGSRERLKHQQQQLGPTN